MITLRAESTIASKFNPYFFINCVGVPDSPNVSLVATNSCGTGLFLTSTLATLSPNPPRKLCSSAVTTQPVLFTDSNIDDSSRGFIV